MLAAGYVLVASALAAVCTGTMWICRGAWPPPGEGSLGHVGLIVIGASFVGLALLTGPLGVLLAWRGHQGGR